MALPLLPLAIAGLVTAAYHARPEAKGPPKGQMTPARQLIFETALNELKDSGKLNKLAEAYRKEGLNAHAEMLEKRAKLRDLPEETKLARRAIFKKAMALQDSAKVRGIADVFEKEGATGAANSLREYAMSLDKAPKPSPPPVAKTEVVEAKV